MIHKSKYGIVKPPIGSQVDWGHPLAHGLVGCWLKNENAGNILINQINPLYNGSLSGGTHDFEGINFDGTDDAVNCGQFSHLNEKRMWTFVVSTKVDVWGGAFICKSDYNSFAFLFGCSGTDELNLQIPYLSTVSLITRTTSAANLSTGKRYQFIGQSTGSDGNPANWKFFVDGVSYAHSGSTDSSSKILDNGKPLFFAKDPTPQLSDTYFDGTIYYVYLYDYAIPLSGINHLYQDPYCFIRRPRIILLDTSSAGRTVNVQPVSLSISVAAPIPRIQIFPSPNVLTAIVNSVTPQVIALAQALTAAMSVENVTVLAPDKTISVQPVSISAAVVSPTPQVTKPTDATTAAFAVPDVTTTVSGDVTVSVQPVTVSASVVAPATEVRKLPAVQTMSASAQDCTIQVAKDLSPLQIIAAVAAPSISITSSPTVTVDPLTLSFSVQSPILNITGRSFRISAKHAQPKRTAKHIINPLTTKGGIV